MVGWRTISSHFSAPCVTREEKRNGSSPGTTSRRSSPKARPLGAQHRLERSDDVLVGRDHSGYQLSAFVAIVTPMRESELRRHLVEICHRMYRQGYIAAADGNVSAKIDGERILVTPTGFHK